MTLVLALLLPLAAADHVFSHRVVVTGRVIDAEGVPVPAQPVLLRIEGLDAEGPCFDSRDERTGPQGDFRLCRHAHGVPEGVRVSVTVGDASAEAPLDPALRRVALHLRLPGPAPARDLEGERLFQQSFRVEGRVMRLEADQVEGVAVPATAVGGERVRVGLLRGAEVLVEANATTDEHGDYAVDLPAGDVPEGTRVRMATAEGERSAPASTPHRRVDLDLVLAQEDPDFPPERPGTTTPRLPLPAWLAVAAVGAAAVIGAGARRRG